MAPPTSVHWRRDVCCVTQKTVNGSSSSSGASHDDDPPPPAPVLVDTLHYWLQTLMHMRETRGLSTLVPELEELAREAEARHLAIEAGCDTEAKQMSLACAARGLPWREGW